MRCVRFGLIADIPHLVHCVMMRGMLSRLKERLAGRGAASLNSASVAWSSFDYSTVYRTIPLVRFESQQDFIDGPFERYLDLVAASPGSPGARIMEHVSASLHRYRESEKALGRSTQWLDIAAETAVRARFRGNSENDLYMVDVFHGRATHNFREFNEEGC